MLPVAKRGHQRGANIGSPRAGRFYLEARMQSGSSLHFMSARLSWAPTKCRPVLRSWITEVSKQQAMVRAWSLWEKLRECRCRSHGGIHPWETSSQSRKDGAGAPHQLVREDTNSILCKKRTTEQALPEISADLGQEPSLGSAYFLLLPGEVFQVALVVKNPPADAGDRRDEGSIPGSGRSPGGGRGNPFQYSCLENPMDKGAWWARVHKVTNSWTRLKRQHTHIHTGRQK